MENKVLNGLASITAELAKIGISKNNKNQQQGYKFRGIDDIYNTLASLLSKNKVIISPEVKSREQVEKTTKNGGSVFYTTVCVDYTIYSAEDGSFIKATIFGEAMDSADKSTNKAMSAAYKYLCLQLFCIPTEGDNDADATTHEIVSNNKKPSEQAEQAEQTNENVIFDTVMKNLKKCKGKEMPLDKYNNAHHQVEKLLKTVSEKEANELKKTFNECCFLKKEQVAEKTTATPSNNNDLIGNIA